MKYLIYSFFAIICLAAPATACEPPDFPKPQDIAQMELILSRHGELTEIEQATLDSYLADRRSYMELYDQAYPCPFVAGADEPRVKASNSEQMVDELVTLKAKWERSDALSDEVSPSGEEEYVDVPDDEMLSVE